MAINPNTTFTAGAILTAAEMNRLPRGIMARVARTAGNITATTVPSDTGVSVTFTAAADRHYKFTILCFAQKLTSESWTFLSLTDNSNNAQGGVIQTAPVNEFANLSFSLVIPAISAGSVTYKLRAQTGLGTATLLASGNDPLMLIVEDVGPA